MNDQLRQQMQAVVPLTDEEMDHVASYFVAQHINRNQLIMSAGEVCTDVYFVKTGCIRYYYISEEGEERTGQFFFENNWYTDYESFLTGSPSTHYIQALETSELLLLPKKSLYELYETNPKVERFGRLMAEQAFMAVKRRNASFLNQDPEERYVELIATRPKLIERVPLHYIASFLGIQPESLSRIRKRLYDNRPKS